MTDTFGEIENKVVTKLSQISDSVIGELALYLAQVGMRIPITQVDGFSGFAAKVATVTTDQTTSSTTYVDLTTVGPTVSGLAKGRYVLLYGAQGFSDTGAETLYNPGLNGSNPASDATAARFGGTGTDDGGSNQGVFASLVDFSTDNNSITMKYKMFAAGTGHWHFRWLLVLKYADF